MRRLSLTNKKVRGIPRRLRALKKWSDSFKGCFPNDLEPNNRYWNWKIPILAGLIEGNHTKLSIQAECAQRLIDACNYLIEAKPVSAKDFRVTCVVCLPDMFTSEMCIYLQESYFRSHTSEYKNKSYEQIIITEKSLAQEWKLSLSENIRELGIKINYKNDDNFHEIPLILERWYFGEV